MALIDTTDEVEINGCVMYAQPSDRRQWFAVKHGGYMYAVVKSHTGWVGSVRYWGRIVHTSPIMLTHHDAVQAIRSAGYNL